MPSSKPSPTVAETYVCCVVLHPHVNLRYRNANRNRNRSISKAEKKILLTIKNCGHKIKLFVSAPAFVFSLPE